MEISGLEYGKIWGNWENLQETLWFSLLIIFLNVFFLLSLLLDGKNPLKIRFCHRKRRNITQKNRGFRRTADPYLRITHFGWCLGFQCCPKKDHMYTVCIYIYRLYQCILYRHLDSTCCFVFFDNQKKRSHQDVVAAQGTRPLPSRKPNAISNKKWFWGLFVFGFTTFVFMVIC